MNVLRTQALFKSTQWQKVRINPNAVKLRVALHAGPVNSGFNPILSCRAFYGSNRDQAAFIKAATANNAVFASETFAAVSLLTGHVHIYIDFPLQIQG